MANQNQSKKNEPNTRNTSGRRTNSWYAIADAHIGPHIVKGEKPHTPTIGEVLRQQHQLEAQRKAS